MVTTRKHLLSRHHESFNLWSQDNGIKLLKQWLVSASVQYMHFMSFVSTKLHNGMFCEMFK